MNKILCPVDFSITSLNAIEFAVNICKKTNGSLVLIHVFTEDEFNEVFEPPLIGMFFKEKYSFAYRKLQSLEKRINEESFKDNINKCSSLMVLGELCDFILEISEDEQCDLVVMGTTGGGKNKNVLVGKNTDEIIKRSKVPVLCIPKLSTFSSFERIVFATNIGEEDKVKIQNVISFATYFESRVNVVHMVYNKNIEEEDKLNDFLSDLKSFVSYDKINFEIKYVENDFGDELLDYINEKKASILFVYSPHRSYFGNLLHKSFHEKLSVVLNTPIYVLK